jgi:ribonuclease PH
VVANADGSIVVNADDIQVGALATDAQHGVRGGASQHAVATQTVHGFLSSTDKTKLDALSGDSFSTTTQTTDATPFDMPAYTLADGKAITFQFSVTARRSDGAAGASFRILAGFRRTGSTVTQFGSTKVIAQVYDPGFLVDATTSINGTTINVRVTGILATTIDWHAIGSSLVIAP